MFKKLKSIIDGNSFDVMKLKLKRKISINTFNLIVSQKEEIPIIINNRNRLYYLKKLLNYLKSKDIKNIIILDNQSTYVPLIDFYQNCDYKIIRLQQNLGYLALWKINLFNKIKNNYYIYTDPDIVPISECPIYFIDYFKEILLKQPKLDKVGFGLKIDDLPNNSLSKKIYDNEKNFWVKKLDSKETIYKAPIDTTFALYKPNSFGGYWLNSARTDFPYLARHLPWYDDKDEKEEIFYKKNIIKNSSFYTSNRFQEY